MIRHNIEENPKIFSFLISLSNISMKQPVMSATVFKKTNSSVIFTLSNSIQLIKVR